jgi:hypothetical protein
MQEGKKYKIPFPHPDLPNVLKQKKIDLRDLCGNIKMMCILINPGSKVIYL